jgi:hypothetical protein
LQDSGVYPYVRILDPGAFLGEATREGIDAGFSLCGKTYEDLSQPVCDNGCPLALCESTMVDSNDISRAQAAWDSTVVDSPGANGHPLSHTGWHGSS